ncbi:MAG: glycerol-3-phosphate 1-O-acyltransferase PlsY [Planctomycetes bacterium]|nr:glycerol-3-phosphate 1-O-acyltransferase PlsY [Planctomycetota bacterium]
MTTAWVVAAYLIGTVSWSYLLVRRMRGIDLRSQGSGNLGATNAGRVLGNRWAALIYLLDLAKGFATVLPPRFAFETTTWLGVPLELAAGLAVVLGHIFPFWLGFKGGKGVATGSGVVFALAPFTGLGAVVVWVLTLLGSRMVSLASILGTTSLPFLFRAFEYRGPDRFAYLCFLTAVAVLVVAMHRKNVVRILQGRENRIGKKKS